VQRLGCCMRRPNGRLKVSRLLVLGAGASYAASVQNSKNKKHLIAPLDKDFCRRLVDLKDKKLGWVRNAALGLIKNWRDDRDIKEFGLEQVIISQLGYLEFFDQIHKRRATPYNHARFLRDVTHMVAFLLSKCQENNENIYQSLTEYVLPGGWRDEVDTRILTFNYDTLLDKHLLYYIGL
jgi:hypothetical protein